MVERTSLTAEPSLTPPLLAPSCGGHDRNRASSVPGSLRCDDFEVIEQLVATAFRSPRTIAALPFPNTPGFDSALARVRRDPANTATGVGAIQSVPSPLAVTSAVIVSGLETDVRLWAGRVGPATYRGPGCGNRASVTRVHGMPKSSAYPPQAIDGERVFFADVPTPTSWWRQPHAPAPAREFRPTWCGWKDLAADFTPRRALPHPLCPLTARAYEPGDRAPSCSSWQRGTDRIVVTGASARPTSSSCHPLFITVRLSSTPNRL